MGINPDHAIIHKTVLERCTRSRAEAKALLILSSPKPTRFSAFKCCGDCRNNNTHYHHQEQECIKREGEVSIICEVLSGVMTNPDIIVNCQYGLYFTSIMVTVLGIVVR